MSYRFFAILINGINKISMYGNIGQNKEKYMFTIEKAEKSYIECQKCGTTNSLKDNPILIVSVAPDDEWSSKLTTIRLCKRCGQELINKIQEATNNE
jgi:hypothetical protein